MQAWRRFFGLTRLRLAVDTSLAYETIKGIEDGQQRGDGPAGTKIAKALGIPFDLMISRNPLEAISFECVQQALNTFAERRVFEPDVVKGGVTAYRRRLQEAPGYYRGRRRRTVGVPESTAEAA
jgi:hypothetical protein